MTICQACWSEIRKRLRSGMRTLEFGSGLSTLLFANYDLRHTVIEDNAEVARDAGPAVQLVGRGADGWYNWEPDEPYDLILIDGPQGEGNRGGVLWVMERLVHDETVIVVDDVWRMAERELVERIEEKLGESHVYHDGLFTLIR